MWAVFIDLAKAYDSIDRGKLWSVFLDELHLPPDLVYALQCLYVDLSSELADAAGMAGIPVRQGLKQGCPCSPLVFSLYFDRVERYVREAVSSDSDTVRGHRIRLLSL
mgnify:FL=1